MRSVRPCVISLRDSLCRTGRLQWRCSTTSEPKNSAHLEMVSTIVHQLTRNLSMEEIEKTGFGPYYIDHTVGVWPQAAGGVPFNACEFQSKGDPDHRPVRGYGCRGCDLIKITRLKNLENTLFLVGQAFSSYDCTKTKIQKIEDKMNYPA